MAFCDMFSSVTSSDSDFFGTSWAMAAVSHGLRAAWNTNSECKWINASQMLEKKRESGDW